MNDEIKKLIREILGDFPEGFNAGVVAGVPGWAGDIGYLLQEYPRALLTDTPLRPPVEYAGTTDSIAKAAGYEIPGTISGQLGAAVGGLLSPGPGDLAKFAPLLGAIPFWHGSPHKFDAFDLSKMGTGEGAQAYGWGAYGAESPKTGQEYARNLANRDPSNQGRLNAHANAQRLAALAGDAKYAADDVRFALEADPQQPQAQLLRDTLEHLESGSYARPLEDTGNLYRGEYAWPDPAKEAATPLTGEDLLQWDKPLSEQPQAKAALERIGKEISLPRMQDAEGAGFAYQHLANAVGGPKNAAALLLNEGIPGIRYLDGMSRDGGSGTYNYVMFDDKGIKLLERNGKPIRGLLNP